MNASTESRLLRLAISKGLLTWDDLDEIAERLPDDEDAENAGGAAAPRRSWVELLLASGRLDRATIDALAAELETGQAEPVTGPREPVPTPPEFRFLADWPRYRLERHLGAGGMGSVYLAWDPALDRRVALKFLHRNDPQQAARFVREARAQARVEHPNICRVHEVGEVDGRPYIAMQHIDGESLSELRGKLAPEAVVALLRDVARAVQAAHRSGLIHRDLKPANILVGTDDAGQRHPYVVDFGLALDQSEESLTRSGMISGTPAYLSPEQAQGGLLDRRSDVYSLGIVLYEMLAGQPPFAGPHPAATLVRILEEEPRPLRKAAPGVPQDLDTIVMKCIEKNPARRYDSAKALADDLERFLDGEPIQARPAGLRYRLGKKLRKHRALAAVTAAAAVSLLALGGAVLHTRWQAGERAELAQRFGKRVSDVEAGLRYAALLPRHDMTASKGMLRRELALIEEEMKSLGPLAEGPGCYALGHGYLALHQVETARRYLERAWQAGEHGPEVAAALGRALGVLYEKALADATQPKSGRKAAREEAERTYRRPAVSYLREAPRDARRSPYLAGLTAFYDGRYDEALAQAREAYRQTPWFYEAGQLEADVHRLRGEEAFDEGRREEALRFYDLAGEVYARLLAAVPSDASLYAADCDRRARRLRVERAVGEEAAANAAAEEEAALATCGRALEVDPELTDALVSQAAILWERADDQGKHGIDPRPALAGSIGLAGRAIALAPGDAGAHKNLALALRLLGSWEMEHGGNPGPSLERSAAAARKAVELQPELASNHNSLGLTWLVIAGDRQRRGLDPVPALRASIASYDRAVALSPRFQPSLINLGNAWNLMVEVQASHGGDPAEATRKAVAAFERAAALSPGTAAIYNNLGNSYLTYGEYLLARGADPLPTLSQAAGHYAKAVALRPDYAYGVYNQAYTERLRAQALLEGAADPSPALRAADAFVATSFRLSPGDADTWLESARVRLIEARWAVLRRQDPARLLDAAMEALRRAEAVNPGAPAVYIAQAQTERLRAEAALAHGRDPAEALRAGLGRADRALAINPAEAQALALRGTLAALAARAETDPARRREKAARAAADLEKALALNPLLRREVGAILEETQRQVAAGL
jgi:serine/threonine-protein kinase